MCTNLHLSALEEEKRAALIAADEASKTPASLGIKGNADDDAKSTEGEGSNHGAKTHSSENNTPSVLQENETASHSLSSGEESKPKAQAGVFSAQNTPNLDGQALDDPSIEGQLSKESSTQACPAESHILPHDLDDKSLMLIFEYLDPMEVMNLSGTALLEVNVMLRIQPHHPEPTNVSSCRVPGSRRTLYIYIIYISSDPVTQYSQNLFSPQRKFKPLFQHPSRRFAETSFYSKSFDFHKKAL